MYHVYRYLPKADEWILIGSWQEYPYLLLNYINLGPVILEYLAW